VPRSNETLDKCCKNKHVASKIIDTLETYQDLSKRSPWMRGSKQKVARGSALRPIRRCLEEEGKVKFAKRTSPFGVIFLELTNVIVCTTL
jgi:hypothetical protein